jgi:predicted nucleic acid-binding protein
MALFFDTSALAKLYHEEVGTAAIQQLLEIPEPCNSRPRLIFSEIISSNPSLPRTAFWVA